MTIITITGAEAYMGDGSKAPRILDLDNSC